jgi:hypothetical protein
VADEVRVAMWSGPRNISTALMRAWENRDDCVVVDEPLYAAYLARTGIDHPGRDAVLTSQPTEPEVALGALLAPLPEGIRVQYVKHMTHHLDLDADLSWTVGLRNVLLIRDPREVVASYVRSRESCEPGDIGVWQQHRLLSYWTDRGSTPPVLDSGDFLRDPEGHLRWLCDWLGVPFSERMLRWPAGPRPSDGVWGQHWYDAVWRSTGFEPWRPRSVELSTHDAAVADRCQDAYQALYARRILL